jgi:hypothetical protein
MSKTIWAGLACVLVWTLTIGCASRQPLGGPSTARNDWNRKPMGQPPVSFPMNNGQQTPFGTAMQPGGQTNPMNGMPMSPTGSGLQQTQQQTPIASSLTSGQQPRQNLTTTGAFNEPAPIAPGQTPFQGSFNNSGQQPPPGLQNAY